MARRVRELAHMPGWWKMTPSEKYLAVARDIHASFEEELFQMEVRDSGEARVAASLVLTVLEQFGATTYLLESQWSSHAPGVVRSMLEALADLLILVDDPKHVSQMRFEAVRSDVLMFEEFAADAEMQKDANAIATLTEWRSQAVLVRDELKAKGFERKTFEQKVKAAKIQSTYVAYRTFSAFAHSHLTTLLVRHAGDRELRYCDGLPEDMKKSVLTIAMSILCQAVQTVPKFSDMRQERIDAALTAADEAWKKLEPS